MGELLLEWKDHDKYLFNKLREFFVDDYLVDFSVTCHGQQIKVHKFVLAVLFPMLKESLGSSDNFSFDQEEAERNGTVATALRPTPQCLNLDNIARHAEDMDYIIQFAYDGKINVPEEHADCLMHIAETMDAKSLKESLSQWHTKRKLAAEPNEPIAAAPLSRLRRRAQLKTISKSVDMVSFGDDVDLISIEESSMSRSMDTNECSRKEHDKVSLNFRSKNDNFKKKSVQRQKSTETPRKETKIDSDKETNYGTPLQERATVRIDRRIKWKTIFKCHQCNYVANYPSLLQRHLKKHAKKQGKLAELKQFICTICNTVLDSRACFEGHRATNCGLDVFTCKYCGHMTGQRSSLRRHIISKHQVDAEGNPVEKNVKCPNCNYVCHAKHQLEHHFRVKHKRLNKFKCKECNYAAAYMSQLQRHERQTHQNIRDYECEECGFRFKSSSALNNHVLIKHKGLKPYQCNICNAGYSSSLSFKAHVQRHEGEVECNFVCHVCEHKMKTKSELWNHLRIEHKIELEEITIEPSHLRNRPESAT